MKWLLVLAVLAGGAYLLAKNGTFSFYAYNVTQDQSGTHVHCYAGCDTDVVQSAKAAADGSASPVVRDALALVAADPSRQTYAETMASLHVLLWRAHKMRRLAGAATIRKEAPGLLARMDGEDSASLVGLRTADVATSEGEHCRTAVMRIVARQQAEARAFALDLAHGRPAWKADASFERGMEQADRLYRADLRPCFAGMSKSDRAQIAYVLR